MVVQRIFSEKSRYFYGKIHIYLDKTMKKPTNEELKNAAIAAEIGEWTEDHPCRSNYTDIKGNP